MILVSSYLTIETETFVCDRDVKRVLFVPYALHDRDAYVKTARDKFRSLGWILITLLQTQSLPQDTTPHTVTLSLGFKPRQYNLTGL